MIKQRLTRRQFFQMSAFGAATAVGLPSTGLASVAAAPTQEAQAAAEQPFAPSLPQPTFNPIASNTPFGVLTDISMGWDGTLWGIDGQGAPHVYDAIGDAWTPHGTGIDAATLTADGQTLFVFRGSEVVPVNPATLAAGAPKSIAEQWPNLPDSFKFGINGAANSSSSSDGLVLFNGGRFIATDGSLPLTSLTGLANWPQTALWKDGVIDGVFSPISSDIFLLRGNEVLIIDPLNKQVVGGPEPLSGFLDLNQLPASWATGVDAVARLASDALLIFKGTAVFISWPAGSGSSSGPTYLGGVFSKWPAAWHPVLQHAPNGRDGNLWSVLPQAQGGWIVQHDGDSWRQVPNHADHVGVGQDNTVMIASAQKLWKFTGAFDGSGFAPVSQASNLIQVSLGGQNTVWARDVSNNVYSFDPASGTLAQNSAIGTAAHIAATNDGSLWHAKPSDGNMHRLLIGSSAAPQAIAVKQNLVVTVNKVAATGFGAAHCLAQDSQGQTHAYRYDSPYVFKTAARYNANIARWLEQGAGRLYFADVIDDNNPAGDTTAQIVALDAHTGAEVAHTDPLPAPLNYGQPVFDPRHNLVYVGSAPVDESSTAPGLLLALDARTLQVKWFFQTAAGIDAPPALNGTRLCVGDRSGKLYLFDTAAAIADSAHVQPRWTTTATAIGAQTQRIAQPAFVSDAEDLIYTAVWSANGSVGSWSVQGQWVSYKVADGSQNDRHDLHDASGMDNLGTLLAAPVRGTLNVSGNATPNDSPALFYHCHNAVVGVGAGPVTKTFALPAGDHIATGLTYDAEASTLWLGSYNGALYCLDVNLNPINHTPFVGLQNGGVFTTPVLYKDVQGGRTVLFGTVNQNDWASAALLGFDPQNGNAVAVPTGATFVYTLSTSVTNGVIYAGGSDLGLGAMGQYPQVFGIRIDQLLQAERDFIIESQLMQDPDETAANGSTDPANPMPPSVARYQTHLTVVDDDKNPRPHEAVKIWADAANTSISVNGQQYTIGPDDTAYAAVATGVDGSLVILSDAKDVNAPLLRVWATFMDPFERILVYPDHEWHNRAAQANADSSADPNRPDPNKPNLSTIKNYQGTQLFNDGEKTQGVPANVAKAIGQMNQGLAPGSNNVSSLAGNLKSVHATNSAAQYVAYTTLGGMHYAPSNARAMRPATVIAPVGFALNKPQNGTHTFTPMTHAGARSAIDALQGRPWDPNNPNGIAADGAQANVGVTLSNNLFTDFWNWLKGAVATIENVIVSVADDIMVGINFVVNGIGYAFKAIVKVVEDVVNAIGTFFVQLAKLIEDVIEALSVLFHFGEIMWTHRWMRDVINHEVGALAAAIIDDVKPQFDKFIGSAEDAIKGWFDTLRGQFGTSKLNNLKGSGSTMHSMFNVGPNSSQKSSQAVPCSANVQKFKTNLPSASTSGSAALAEATKVISAKQATGLADFPGQDVLQDFINSFVVRITGDGDLSASFNQFKTDFGNVFKSTSVSDFFSNAIAAFLDIIETFVLGAVAIGGALIDGLFGIVADIVQLALAVLNSSIEIPFISWLYKLLFNEDLTILNALTLIAAIPATIVFRVVEGQYPSQAGLPAANALPNGPSVTINTRGLRGPQRVQDIPAAQKIAAKVLGVFNGMLIVVQGIGAALGDGTDIKDTPAVTNVMCGVGVCIAGLSIPVLTTEVSSISSGDWASWGVSAVLCFIATINAADDTLFGSAFSAGFALLNVLLLIISIGAFIGDGQTDAQSDINLAANITSIVPGILNPIKLLVPGPGNIFVAAVDVIAGVVWGALTIEAALAISTSATRQRLLFFPWVPYQPALVAAR